MEGSERNTDRWLEKEDDKIGLSEKTIPYFQQKITKFIT